MSDSISIQYDIACYEAAWYGGSISSEKLKSHPLLHACFRRHDVVENEGHKGLPPSIGVGLMLGVLLYKEMQRTTTFLLCKKNMSRKKKKIRTFYDIDCPNVKVKRKNG